MLQRCFDSLGRITIPIEIRRQYGFNEGDLVNIENNGEVITISKPLTKVEKVYDLLGTLNESELEEILTYIISK